MRRRAKPHRCLPALAAPLLLLALSVPAAGDSVRLASAAEAITLASAGEEGTARHWFEAIGRHFDLDLTFDSGFHDGQAAFALTAAGPEEALDRVAAASGKMWVALDERSLLVADDNPQNRRKYEPQMVQTFYLENASPGDVMTLLRATMQPRSLVVSDALGAVTIRDTPARVALARRLVERHDRAPAILEVDVRLVRLSDEGLRSAVDALSAQAGPGALPSRLDSAQADELAAAGRVVLRPTLSFADGERARLQIAPTGAGGKSADGGPELDLAVRGSFAAADRAITLEVEIEGASAGDLSLPAEHRRLSSSARLQAGETWAVGGLLRAAVSESGEADQLVILLTPRIAVAGTVQTADRRPLAVGTETNLGLAGADREDR